MKTFFAVIGVVAVIVFGIMFIGALSAVHSPSDQSVPRDVDGATPVAQTLTPPIPVRAERLHMDYQRNEVAADAKYRGKRLLVSGFVTSINKDFIDNVYIELGTLNEFEGVHATLQPSQIALAGELSKGEQVTILCEGSMMVLGSPMLKDCVFQNASIEGQAPAPTYTPQPPPEPQPATVPAINAVNITPTPATAPSRQSVDAYEDDVLRVMKTHWVIPSGVPPGAVAEMSFKITADGRVYDTTVTTPSVSEDLDQSCLDALNQMQQMNPTPTRQVLEVDFDCRATR